PQELITEPQEQPLAPATAGTLGESVVHKESTESTAKSRTALKKGGASSLGVLPRRADAAVGAAIREARES
ncbi:unnamed protein product, partial [Amoebophrya sp. A25]